MTPIEKLAEKVGFHTSYVNSFGEQIYATDESRYALLKAMGFTVGSDTEIEAEIYRLTNEPWLDLLPACKVIHAEDEIYTIAVRVTEEQADETLHWQIVTESGDKLTGKYKLSEQHKEAEHLIDGINHQRIIITLPKLAQGYHTLTASIACGEKQVAAETALIVAPKSCYHPEEAADYKMWGLAAQLYSLKSDNSWGVGDFGDLKKLVADAADKGASTIGLNPLHPLFPDNPAHRSPYSPTSRNFLNTIYIDVTQAPNFAECKPASKLVNSKKFQQECEQANGKELIDYPYAAHLKYQVLELLYADFEKEHQQKSTPLAKEFEQFCQQSGDELKTLSTFDTLYEYFRRKDENAYGWTSWPLEYQNPDSKEVIEFQKKHSSRIGYFEFLQWLANRQLQDVAKTAKEKGMPVGLYMDLAVGCDGGGADVWANRSVYVSGGAVGAPPDACNLLGQDWGLTPINPVALKEQGFWPLVSALRSSMRHAGALRIDHVLGYMRQYWVAPGKKADQGMYISFPFKEMLRVIALESRRAECIVIGEDLGTTPDGFAEIMAEAGLLSYRVLFFERWESGLFMRPDHYPEQALVTVSTHDLPTLAGWWTGNDLVWRQKLNLYPNEEFAHKDRNERVLDRDRFVAALVDMGVLKPEEAPPTAPAVMNQNLAMAAQRYLARTASRIQVIPMEDAIGIHQQVNIPGTVDEHPNWKQRLSLDTDEIWQQLDMKNLLKVMNEERPKG